MSLDREPASSWRAAVNSAIVSERLAETDDDCFVPAVCLPTTDIAPDYVRNPILTNDTFKCYLKHFLFPLYGS